MFDAEGQLISQADQAEVAATTAPSLFTVAAGEMRIPDFGSEWTLESEDERAKFRKVCNVPATQTVDNFCLFRISGGDVRIYLSNKSNKDGFTTHVIQPPGIAPLLPRTLHIDSQIGLPNSVSLHDLINGPDNASGIQAMERDQRATLFEAALAGLHFRRPCLPFPRQAWSTTGRGL